MIFEVSLGGIILERLVTIKFAHDVNSAYLERKMGTSNKQDVVLYNVMPTHFLREKVR